MNDHDEQPDAASALVDPYGRSARRTRAAARTCPRCGAGPEKRVASSGFGDPHPICGRCGHEFYGERIES